MPPQDDGNVPVSPPDQISVNSGGMIRTFTHYTSGSIGIRGSSFAGNGIVIHTAVHISGRYQKPQSGPSKHGDACRVLPVGLGNNSHLVSVSLQHSADNGMPKGGMIHIGVSDHIYKIQLADASLLQILRRNW